MSNEMMNVEEAAVLLQRDAREVSKLASRGHLPGHKVGGQWRFARSEITHWIETQLHAYTEQQLTALETAATTVAETEPLVTSLLSEACVSVPLVAATKASVLRALVKLAEQSWQVYDAEAVLEAVRHREELGSTALANGVAILHPRRALPAALGECVIAYGRTASGIPFGAPDRALTDVFFLVASRDDRTHLKIQARLSRLMLQPEFLGDLRDADTAEQTVQVIAAAEADLLGV